MNSTTVSIRADEQYKNAVRALANQKRQRMADMIRHAVDTVYGTELAPYLDFFVAHDDHKNDQSAIDNAGEKQS